MSENKITGGEVAITLDGASYTLVPTLRAALTVNKLFGGFIRANDRLVGFDLEAVIMVIEAGLGDKSPKNVAEKVFAEGIHKLAAPAIEFVGILANGGKRYSVEEEPKENPQAAG